MESRYIYSVRASSTTLRGGMVSTDEVEAPIAFSAPTEFQGEPGNWTPEHFLIAAVASCFVSTFSGMAHFSKFEFLSLEVDVEGIIGKDQGGWRFNKITVNPRLKISRDKERERARRLLEKAEITCLVVRSLASEVTLEPEILVEEEMLEVEKAGNSFPIT